MPGVHDRDIYRKMTKRFLSMKWTRTADQASALTIIPDEERGNLRSPGARNSLRATPYTIRAAPLLDHEHRPRTSPRNGNWTRAITIHQKGMSLSSISGSELSGGLVLCSALPFPFPGLPRNRSCRTTTSLTVCSFPSRSSYLRVCRRPSA